MLCWIISLIRFLNKTGMLCIPLCARGENLGVIVIGLDQNESSRVLEHAHWMNQISSQAAIALYVDYLKQNQSERIQSERLRATSTLTKKLVHELNTPLSIIKNYVAVMKGKLSTDSPIKEELGFIGEEIDRVSQTIEAFSDFSKLKGISIESINLDELISDLTKVLVKSGLLGSHIKLHLKLDENLPLIKTDKNKLKQIFLNLLRNAVEAMPNGGNIYIRTRYMKNHFEPPIDQNRIDNGAYAEISIKDDGPGIPDDMKSKIFDAFRTTKGPAHQGLGLSIVFNLVQELKGTITCESDREHGTCFKLLLPFPADFATLNEREEHAHYTESFDCR